MRPIRSAAAGLALVTVAAGAVVLTGPSATASKDGGQQAAQPLVIGHRGASGYRPEHTLAAYQHAIDLGADFIEPDLVSTKDGVLVARHENEIAGTTDVESRPEFASRRTTKVIDGVSFTGWFTEDFTLAELRTLRAEERIPATRQENTLYDGRYAVPTFDEVLALAKANSRGGRTVGVYPETKHPTYHDTIGLSLEEPLLADLREAGLSGAKDRVFIQSFEVSNLRELAPRTSLPLVQLLGSSGRPADFTASGDPRTYTDLTTRDGLRFVASYADGLGPNKERVIPRRADGTLGTPTPLVADAHAAGLLVHPYTFRNENTFLPVDLRRGTDPTAYGNAFAEYAAYLATGIDGLFSDNPDTAVAARRDVLRAAS